MTPIIQFIKDNFGADTTRIVSEVILQNDRLHVTIRVSGKPAETFPGQLEDLDDILLEAAEHIYQYTQPYFLAAYLYGVDKIERCREIIPFILRNPPDEDDAWAYNLWGLT